MWRGDGKNSGIAIGFSHSKCASLPGMCLIRREMYERLFTECEGDARRVRPKYEQSFIPWIVMYDDKRKLELVEATIELGLDCFRNQSKSSRKRGYILGIPFLLDMIFYLILFFKHRGFSGEEECRIVEHFVKTKDNHECSIQFHERGGIVLPFIKLQDDGQVLPSSGPDAGP